MCLVFVAWRAHPRYRLLVAANRDEYHARPTAPAAPWEAAPYPGDRGPRPAVPDPRAAGSIGGVVGAAPAPAGGEAHLRPAGERRVLAGRDLVGGGTWLGVTANGRFAALTNYRGSAPPRPEAPSRGRLVAGFLRGALDAREYAREVAREAERYSGFHLLLADRDALFCVTNVSGGRVTEAPAGCHGLGNDRLNAPEPKVTGGLAEFHRLVLRREPEPGGLFDLLADDEPAAEADVRGSDPERAAHSARFVRGPGYGTRSSTVVRIAGDGAIAFEERSFDAWATETGRAAFERPAAAGAGFAAARTSAGSPARPRFRDVAAD